GEARRKAWLGSQEIERHAEQQRKENRRATVADRDECRRHCQGYAKRDTGHQRFDVIAANFEPPLKKVGLPTDSSVVRRFYVRRTTIATLVHQIPTLQCRATCVVNFEKITSVQLRACPCEAALASP